MGPVWRTGWALMAGLVVGCGPMIVLEGETENGESTGPGTSTTVTAAATSSPPPPPPPPSSTTTPIPPSDSSTTGIITTGVSFLDDGLGTGVIDYECDLWAQDCPEDEKCMPWANDGGSVWNATRCSPIAHDPGAPGDSCTVEGSGVSGIDSCGLGVMCFYVDADTDEGTCVAFCVGNPARPTCEDPGANCVINGEGILALCIPTCDPIGQDCPKEQACYDIGGNFLCVPDESGEMGAAGDPCEFVNVCDPGTFCAQPDDVPDCMGIGCCTAYCSADDPMPPCLPGQVCSPYYEPEDAPEGLELLGACVVP